jgi:hypothetical protein
MSLNTRLLEFVQAVGADIKSILATLATKASIDDLVESATTAYSSSKTKSLVDNLYNTFATEVSNVWGVVNTKAAKGANADITSIRAAQYVDKKYVNAAATGAVSLDVSQFGEFDMTLTGNSTFSFTNVPSLAAGESLTVVVRLTSTGTAYTATWMTATWHNTTAGAPAPAPAITKTQEYVFTISSAGVIARKGGATL